jgi:hypothetical protein
MTTTATYDLEINQGATYSLQLAFQTDQNTPMDLTGYAGLSEIRHNATRELAATFTVTIVDTLLGLVSLELSAEDAALLPFSTKVPNLAYDLVFTIGTEVLRALEGSVSVSRQVTVIP